MHLIEKEITYNTNNSYDTLNQLSDKTKNVWFVCHGMGYLSKYFIKHFKKLNAEENYIIAPQAPSKYYIQPKMYVGANWLTKERTVEDMNNILNYFDAILEKEVFPKNINLIVLGYSQGVSVALRYVAKKKLYCNKLVIHSGGIPIELKTSDFDFLKPNSEIILIYGTEDEYLNEERIIEEKTKAKHLFGDKLTIIPFTGKHIVNEKLILDLQ